VERLRPEVVDGACLRTDAERGAWLARTLHATGILDPEAVGRLLVPASGGGVMVDASRLDADHPPEDDGPSERGARGLASVPALFASEVTADDLERWVGFVRYARSVQVVPDTRGKDLDLVFDTGRIRRRLTTWYDAARARAAGGAVLVVIAGDGMRADPAADALVAAHHALVRAPGVRYLRLQHAQSATVAWLRTLAGLVGGRPGASVRLEGEHGSTVNVVLVGVAPAGTDPSPDDLDAWEITATAVVLSDLASERRHQEEVALFTDDFDGDVPCAELVAFGRAHVERLLHATEPVADPAGAARERIARWVEQVRVFRPVRSTLPADPAARGRWVARRFGLSDATLALAIASTLDDDLPAAVHADRLWRAATDGGAEPAGHRP
jgi:hypothetical protein